MKKLKKNMKSQTKRNQYKYAAIEKTQNLKTRQSAIDDVKEYFHKLSPEEKEWMNNFMEEYNNANFNHSGQIIHKSKKLKKDCYNKNNSRNRCIATREQAKGMLNYIENNEELEEFLNNEQEEEEDIYYEPKMKL